VLCLLASFIETFYYACIENASSLKMFSWFCSLDCLHLLLYKFSGCVSVGPSWHAVRGNDRIRFARCFEDTVPCIFFHTSTESSFSASVHAPSSVSV